MAAFDHERGSHEPHAARALASFRGRPGRRVRVAQRLAISARDNVSIMERTKSPAVLTYYDVGNSTKGGFNVVEEIRWLGVERICEMHLKDNPHYLGKGTIDFPAVVDALADIGFRQWAQLVTDSPSGWIEKDMATNLAYIRGVIDRRNWATS